MLRFVARRLLGALFVLFVVSVMVFLIFFKTPGIDPARLMAGPNATPATVDTVKQELGLDQPLVEQYVTMMQRLFVTRDLPSFVNQGEEVIPEVARAVPVTLSLAVGAVVIWFAVSTVLGVIGAYTTKPRVDLLISVVSMATLAIPVLWLGELANLVSQATLHDTFLFSWVPEPGYVGLLDSPGSWALHLILPWLVLSLHYIGLYARVLRTTLLETESEDYMRTARAKGLSERRVVVRHALRTSLATLMSVFAMDIGALVGGGAIVVEVIFGLPGVGMLMYHSLSTLDIPVIMATALYGAFFIVMVNVLVDILNARLDPRITLA